MEGSTVTDSSLLPMSMPVPLQPQAPPAVVNNTESSTQTLTFADLFSQMISAAETSSESSEFQLATDLSTSLDVLAESSPIPTQLQAIMPDDASALPALLQPETDVPPLAQVLPDVAVTVTTTADTEGAVLAPVTDLSRSSERLPALISEILSRQQTAANTQQTQTAPSPTDGEVADSDANAIATTKLQKTTPLQDGQPAATGLRGAAEVDDAALTLTPKPSRMAPPVQESEEAVESEEGLGRATSVLLTNTTIQRPSVAIAATAAGSIKEQTVAASEALASPIVTDKSVTVHTRLEPAGPEQLGDRLMVMINRDLKQVHIRMDPPELGHLKIALTVDGDQVSVQFTASQPGLRELIVQQTDRLRQHLEAQQLNLVNVDVSTDQGRDSRHPAHEYGPSTSVPLFSADVFAGEGGLPVTVQQYSAGLLDIFA